MAKKLYDSIHSAPRYETEAGVNMSESVNYELNS